MRTTHFSGKAVRLALQWPSMSTRVLVRKLAFLCKLLSDQSDVEVISRDIFSSLASVDVYSISIIQQCRMLESFLGTSALARCLNAPSEARSILSNYKCHLITKDFELLLEHSLSHKTAKIVASVAKTTSWCRLWDTALDCGVKGTRGLQTLLREMCRPVFENSVCNLCNESLNVNDLWLDHICHNHPEIINNKSLSQIVAALHDVDSDTIFSFANSNLNKCSLTNRVTL